MRRSTRLLNSLVLGFLIFRQVVLWIRSASSSLNPTPRTAPATTSTIEAPHPIDTGRADLPSTTWSPQGIIGSIEETTLSVSFEPSPEISSTCVPWSVNTDEWWTHHVTWEVGPENRTHTCFRRRSAADASAMQVLYDAQFLGENQNCTYRRMWSDGFGSDLRNVLDGLLQAEREGRTFSYDASPWHYAALQDGSNPVCEERTMACYFLPLSSCKVDRQVPHRTDLSNRPPPFGRHRMAVEFLIRPRQWLRRRVHEYGEPLRRRLDDALHHEGGGEDSCAVVHVRRGDVVLGESHTSRRSYHPLSDYLRHVRTHTVLLLTDDANAIDETRLYPNISWVYYNRTRYRGSEGGWEEHLPSRDPANEVVALLSAFELVQRCGTLIHTASNFGQFLFYRMTAARPQVRRVNLGK